MSQFKILAAAATTALALAGPAASAFAATAHNSQAGALGPNSHQCAATAYFPADPSCFPADVLTPPNDARSPPAARHRHRQLVPDPDD